MYLPTASTCPIPLTQCPAAYYLGSASSGSGSWSIRGCAAGAAGVRLWLWLWLWPSLRRAASSLSIRSSQHTLDRQTTKPLQPQDLCSLNTGADTSRVSLAAVTRSSSAHQRDSAPSSRSLRDFSCVRTAGHPQYGLRCDADGWCRRRAAGDDT